MSIAKAQFQTWFVESLKPLRNNGDAGFIFVLTAFPLIERYLRRKCGCLDGESLTDAFFAEVGTIFGIDGNQFWSCYRNGLLHHVAFATAKRNNKAGIWVALPESGLSAKDPRPVYFNTFTNQFFMNPLAFYDKVIELIIADFATYESETSKITQHFILPNVVDLPLISLSDGTGSYNP